MNNFEFLRYVTIGQYIPTGSWVHNLDARARILGTIFILGAVTFTQSFIGLAVAMTAVLLLLVLARIPLGYALRGLLPPLPFLLILAVLQIFFSPGTDQVGSLFQWGWIHITVAGLWSAAILLLRFSTLILTLSLASFSISTSEMIHGLEMLLRPLTRLGIPTHDFVMMIQVMLRFLPFLALAAERIAKSQASRGAEWGSRRGGLVRRVRQVIPLIVPLFLTGLRRAENLALAMDARGYGNRAQHTSMVEMQFLMRDALALLAAFGLSVVVLWV